MNQRTPTNRSSRRPLLSVCLSFAMVSLVASAAEAEPGAIEGLAIPDKTESCFWLPALSDDDLWNFVYIDEASVYLAAAFRVPDGAELFMEAEYPRARSLSWTAYGQGVGGVFGGAHQLIDLNINPDPGSTNPFIPGNFRKSNNRSYMLHLRKESKPSEDPSDFPDNVLFIGPTPEPGAPGIAALGQVIVVRMYVPDRGTDVFGGSALPEAVLVYEDGTEVRGEALCQAVRAQNHGAVPEQGLGFSRDFHRTQRDRQDRPRTWPAQNPPDFKAFFNAAHQTCSFFTPEEECPPPIFNPAGIGFGNPANRYLESWLDRGHGRVLVLRGKAPTTPKTKNGNPFLADDDPQVRYWSICAQESQATWRISDCAHDEEIPTDGDGYYTVVVSRASFRPKNATEKCGVAFVENPPGGDGMGDAWLYNMWIRHQLPSPNFTQSTHAVEEPGTEAEVMGEYFPVGEYMSTEEFEALGCPNDSRSNSRRR